MNRQKFISMLADDTGQSYAEYCVLMALVVIIGMVAVKALGVKIAAEYNTVTSQLP